MRDPHLAVGAARDEALLLVAHGSRDPRAGYVVSRLADEVSRHTGAAIVRVAHLDFTGPTPQDALQRLATDGVSAVRVVPLLFTPGYHVRHDVPAAVRDSGVGDRVAVCVAPALLDADRASRDLLLDGLVERLAEATSGRGGVAPVDGVVLASAGSSSATARQYVERLTTALAAKLGVPGIAAYASTAAPTAGEAVQRLRLLGCRRPAVASLFVAPGRLPDAVTRSAAGVPVADPLGVTTAFVAAVARQARLSEPVG